MEVDRIWRIDGLDSNANPAWQNSARRRRRFVEEVPAEENSEASEEEAPEGSEPDHAEPDRAEPEHDRPTVTSSDDGDAAETPSESSGSFRAIA